MTVTDKLGFNKPVSTMVNNHDLIKFKSKLAYLSELILYFPGRIFILMIVNSGKLLKNSMVTSSGG